MVDSSQVVREAHEALYSHSGDIDSKLDRITLLITNMNVRINDIDVQVKKIDKVQQTLSALSGKVSKLEHELGNVKVKNLELEKSIHDLTVNTREYEHSAQALGDLFDTIKAQVEVNTASVNTLRDDSFSDVSLIRKELATLRKEKDEMSSLILDLQCRSMKNNLIFHGLTGESKDEDTERRLRDFLHNELGIDYRMELGNVHRFGKYTPGKARPIVARFIFYKELDHVLKLSWKLKNKPYSITEQFPREVEDRRRQLYPIRKKARADNLRTKMVRDKLFIEGKLYVPGDQRDPARDDESDDASGSSRSVIEHSPSIFPRSKRRRRFTKTPPGATVNVSNKSSRL